MESTILQFLADNEKITDSASYAAQLNEEHQTVVGILKSLESKGLIVLEAFEENVMGLTNDGELCLQNGSFEVQVFNAVPAEGIDNATLNKQLGVVAKVGVGKCMQNNWIVIDKSSGKPIVRRKVETVEDVTKANLLKVRDGQTLAAADMDALKRSKLVAMKKVTKFAVTKGEKFTTTLVKEATDLTAEMLKSGTWRSETFKSYNYNAAGKKEITGYLHPLLKVRAEFKKIFLEMGFEEMKTNNWVESSFWNFDALFQPQQHPARDSHDTFFLASPASTTELPSDYVERVKQVHEKGGYGSIGYRYNWSLSEAQKNVLRTHTTAVSSRYLYQLAQQKPFQPRKFFSIDRVFRNEEMDATHLCEFHQIEGMVVDENLTLGEMIGLFSQFFAKIGIHNLRFKPAYNPYTEPSMEIFGYHPLLRRWVEIGNSGIFRPEMLLPMGLPENVRVLAWGLSLERPTMIMYNVDDIRDLFGYKVDIKMISSNPICRLDKV